MLCSFGYCFLAKQNGIRSILSLNGNEWHSLACRSLNGSAPIKQSWTALPLNAIKG
jgi:hypothetical protein